MMPANDNRSDRFKSVKYPKNRQHMSLGSAERRGGEGGDRDFVHGVYRGRSRETLFQHLPCAASQLL